MFLYIPPPERPKETTSPPGIINDSGPARVSPGQANGRISYPQVDADFDSELARSVSLRKNVAAPPTKSPFALWEKRNFGFGDIVDMINPLQHIPIVSAIYRDMTNDRIGILPRVIGGAIWGRIGGFISGLVNAIVDVFTGKDVGEHIVGWFKANLFAEEIQTALKPTSNPSKELLAYKKSHRAENLSVADSQLALARQASALSVGVRPDGAVERIEYYERGRMIENSSIIRNAHNQLTVLGAVKSYQLGALSNEEIVGQGPRSSYERTLE